MPDKYVQTVTELADELGLARQNIHNTWISKEGFPTKSKSGWSVRLCAEFIKEYKADQAKKQQGVNADLKRRKLELECEKLQVGIDIMKGDYISMADHLKEMAQHAGAVKAVFRQWSEAIKASGAGVDLIKEAKRLEERCLVGLREAVEGMEE
jgi:hypothetical protein